MCCLCSEKKNYNNHPFLGNVEGVRFALAHNGVLCNDRELRESLKLPGSKIETDSYIGVQLIESRKNLGFDSLKYMAEQVEGSFTFTVLDQSDNLYIVKGDNPLCLYRYPKTGLFIYASTQSILERALEKLRFKSVTPERVELKCGYILRIDKNAAMTWDQFGTSKVSGRNVPRYYYYNPYIRQPTPEDVDEDEWSYWEELKTVAAMLGYTPEVIDRALAHGFAPDEIEEMLYCGSY